MQRSAVVLFVFFFGAAAFGTSGSARQSDQRIERRTDVPADARFDVVETVGRETLRLDKFTGQVWYLRQQPNLLSQRGWVWRPITPVDAQPAAPGVNYRLVSATENGTLLVHVQSGAVWVLGRERTELTWLPVTNER